MSSADASQSGHHLLRTIVVSPDRVVQVCEKVQVSAPEGISVDESKGGKGSRKLSLWRKA